MVQYQTEKINMGYVWPLIAPSEDMEPSWGHQGPCMASFYLPGIVCLQMRKYLDLGSFFRFRYLKQGTKIEALRHYKLNFENIINAKKQYIIIFFSTNAADVKFDLVIGCIEDIIMGKTFNQNFLYDNIKLNFIDEEPKFQELQDQFMEKNYKHFEESDENKLIYTTIHKEYVMIKYIYYFYKVQVL